MKKVIFDTDPGIDDAMALQLIHASPALELLGVTTVFGNASVEDTTRNAFYLAEKLGVPAPIRKGAAGPIVQPLIPPPAHIHGGNGLGDIDLSGFVPPPVDAEPAHDFIVRTIKAHPGEISLIAVGPLTNLALALQAAPEIAGLVREVVIMGGAFGYGRRRGNASPVAEANLYNDPHAADLVFTAPWPVTAIGLDVTSDCVFTDALAEQLGRETEAGSLIWRISRGYSAIYRKIDNLEGCCLHDVAAAVCCIDPSVFQFNRGPVRVATEGVAVGESIQKLEGLFFPPGDWDGHPSQKAARAVDAAAVVRLFAEAVRRSPPLSP